MKFPLECLLQTEIVIQVGEIYVNKLSDIFSLRAKEVSVTQLASA